MIEIVKFKGECYTLYTHIYIVGKTEPDNWNFERLLNYVPRAQASLKQSFTKRAQGIGGNVSGKLFKTLAELIWTEKNTAESFVT